MAMVYWKEKVSVLFIGGIVYLHYFVLIPQLWLKRKNLLFWICVVLLLVVIVAAEMLLVDSDIHEHMTWIKDFTLFYVVVQPLSDDLKRLLDYLNEHPGASVHHVAKALYFSTRTAQRRMTELRLLGLLNSSKRG